MTFHPLCCILLLEADTRGNIDVGIIQARDYREVGIMVSVLGRGTLAKGPQVEELNWFRFTPALHVLHDLQG